MERSSSANAKLSVGESDGDTSDRLSLLWDLVDGLPAPAFAIGPDGRVLISNLSREAGAWSSDFEVGILGSPVQDLLKRLPLGGPAQQRMREQIEQVVAGAVVVAHQSYEAATAERYILTVRATRLQSPEGLTLVILWGARAGEQDRHSRRRQQITILQAQEEERRRIARELHDGTSQQLALIQVSLDAVRKSRSFEEIDNACTGIEAAVQTAHHQIRTLSYVLHPPELGSNGIVEALASFLKGFARRAGLVVSFDNLAGRLKHAPDLEIALYRVAQEALINVAKHAGATHVDVRLLTIDRDLYLEIEDNGVGISPEVAEGRVPEALGVGLEGMRERVEALGGDFYVQRGDIGTQVRARFPRRRRSDF